ncbi:FAD-dependent oxidoreductase [Streptomyces murinus]|uniref:NAD(P)/FAD-dependent oxidoreductase n=2 Tax=Streptomyces TaxID=1883 RepID=UPI002E0FED1B
MSHMVLRRRSTFQRRYPVQSPDSFWLATGPVWEGSTRDLPRRAGVCVLGAGVMGSTLAYWLARDGHSPLVLERNPSPAMGSSGRNAGRVIQGGNAQHANAIAKFGAQEALAIYRATLDNRDLLREVTAREGLTEVRTGAVKLDLAETEEEALLLKHTAEALNSDGIEAEWLDHTDAQAVFGTRLPEQVLGGLSRPDQETVHSVRYVRGVAKAAVRHGAEFACGVTVLGVEPAAGSGWRVLTDAGVVLADQVVVALNAWVPHLFPELSSVIVPVRGHLVQTEPVPFRIAQWGLNHGLVYGGQTPDGSLLLGGLRNTLPDRDENITLPPGDNAPDVLPGLIDQLASVLPQLIPEADGAPVVRAWSGVMAFTPDRCPLVGAWPGAEGLWLIAGFNGHGMPYSQAMPKGLAERIGGGQGLGIPGSFDPARFLA